MSKFMRVSACTVVGLPLARRNFAHQARKRSSFAKLGTRTSIPTGSPQRSRIDLNDLRAAAKLCRMDNRVLGLRAQRTHRDQRLRALRKSDGEQNAHRSAF